MRFLNKYKNMLFHLKINFGGFEIIKYNYFEQLKYESEALIVNLQAELEKLEKIMNIKNQYL